MNRAVFLDRDGVINVNRDDHVKSWDEFVWAPGALEGLRLLASLPIRVVVVTNQSVVGRGIISHAQLDDIHRRMLEAVGAEGGRIDGIYVCPHAPWEDCSCRKPKPGLLLQAARELAVDLSRSFMIGDRAADIETGRAVGACTVLIDRAGIPTPEGLEPDHIATSLLGAVEWLLPEVWMPACGSPGQPCGGARRSAAGDEPGGKCG
jgi:D-glycero-D-manno-heptose 1,7-bisphosphate phosphatase